MAEQLSFLPSDGAIASDAIAPIAPTMKASTTLSQQRTLHRSEKELTETLVHLAEGVTALRRFFAARTPGWVEAKLPELREMRATLITIKEAAGAGLICLEAELTKHAEITHG
jgi:hypothetical protein